MFLKQHTPSKQSIFVIVCRCCGSWLQNDQWRYGSPPTDATDCICPKCKQKKNRLRYHDYR